VVGDLRFPVAGQHGLERRDIAGRLTRPEGPSRDLVAARDLLTSVVGRYPDLLFEDKGLSLALHYRRAPQLASHVHRVVRSLASRLGPGWVVQAGKRVVELKPAGRDKGAAVRDFMEEPPFTGRTPVFVGDDQTDEHGFAMVNRLGGHSVKVGPGPTAARWRLPDVAAVRAWLERRPGHPA
jgi:trehalose 6-phosphate phosphatase